MNHDLLAEVKAKVAPLLTAEDIELVELTMARERGRFCLRFLVTKAKGITLDECTQLNQKISQILDQQDLIQESYILEVSSPGLDRPLVSTRDFQRCLGKLIRIVLHQPINGENVWKGFLAELDEEKIIIENKERRSFSIPRKNIARARQEIDFR